MTRSEEAPRSGPRRPPGGSVQKREQDLVCNTNVDDSFRTCDVPQNVKWKLIHLAWIIEFGLRIQLLTPCSTP
jgi:hypothetical protein